MDERYIKRGETRQATDADHLWLMGLLRYTRDVEMITPQVSDALPNITVLFGGLTFGFRPGRLQLLFKSLPSTDHARYITAEHAQAKNNGLLDIPNAALHVVNMFSKENTLRMKARARELTHPWEIEAGLVALNAVRELKGWPEVSLAPDPDNDEDMGQALYVADVLFADTQGERYSTRGNHVGEGHPVIDIAQLQGFEKLPPYTGEGHMPDTKEGLFSFLRMTNAIPDRFASLQ